MDNMKKRPFTLWSDSIFIDNNIAFMVTGRKGCLFSCDLKSGETKYISTIPAERMIQRYCWGCIRVGEHIYCLPYDGKEIWIYDLDASKWSSIIVDESFKGRLLMCHYEMIDDTLLLYSCGKNSVLFIDVREKKKTKEIQLPGDPNYTLSIRPWGSKGEDVLFSNDSNTIYYSSTLVDEFKTINLTNGIQQDDSLCRLVKSGSFIWGCGYFNQIYKIDINSGETYIINDFPKDFGRLNFYEDHEMELIREEKHDLPTFIYSFLVGNYVCYIPFQTSHILFVDITTDEVRGLYIPEEEITTQDKPWEWECNCRFMAEYVREDRWIGLYGMKTGNRYEFDIINWDYDKKSYFYYDSDAFAYFRQMLPSGGCKVVSEGRGAFEDEANLRDMIGAIISN